MAKVTVETKEEISAEEMFGGKEVTVVSETGAVGIFNPEQTRFYSSLPNGTMQEKGVILKALGNSDYTLKNVADKKILMVKHILAHGIELVSEETGEKEQADRIVMIMEDGQTISGCSKGFKSSVTNLMAIYGQPPFSPALPIIVCAVETRKGRGTFNLGIAEDGNTMPRIGGISK